MLAGSGGGTPPHWHSALLAHTPSLSFDSTKTSHRNQFAADMLGSLDEARMDLRLLGDHWDSMSPRRHTQRKRSWFVGHDAAIQRFRAAAAAENPFRFAAPPAAGGSGTDGGRATASFGTPSTRTGAPKLSVVTGPASASASGADATSGASGLPSKGSSSGSAANSTKSTKRSRGNGGSGHVGSVSWADQS